MENRLIIFSDIDGTLMDLTTFDMGPVIEFLPDFKKYSIPLILCSAKTMAEQERIRSILQINDPFIVENGGGIYIPSNYFPIYELNNLKKNIRISGNYIILELGVPYKKIREILCKIRAHNNLTFVGFGDLDVDEVSRLTGLTVRDAHLAKQREFDETIIIPKNEIDILRQELERYGLTCIHGGRFYHVIGAKASKGDCVKILNKLFSNIFGKKPISIGIGDSPNDMSMLMAVDIPFLVEKKHGGWTNVDLLNIKKVKGIGPKGWVNAVKEIIQNLSP